MPSGKQNYALNETIKFNLIVQNDFAIFWKKKNRAVQAWLQTNDKKLVPSVTAGTFT